MDKTEARGLADEALESLRSVGYETLVEQLLNKSERLVRQGPSGTEYYIQLSGAWDSGKPGDLRVSAMVDEGGLRAFAPLVSDFIISADGSFVGE